MIRHVSAVVRLLLVFVFVLICVWLALVELPLSGKERRARVIKRWTGRFPVWTGVRVETRGDTDLLCRPGPGGRGRLVVCNHSSFLDVFVLMSHGPMRFVAKKEIAGWPVIGKITQAGGTLFIDRSSRRSLCETLGKVSEALEAGENVLFFPEGTTSPGDRLLPLHANFFAPAAHSGAELVPAVLRYRSRGEPTTRASYSGGTGLVESLWNLLLTPEPSVRLEVLEPLRGDDRRALCREASRRMSAALGVTDPMAEPSARKTKSDS